MKIFIDTHKRVFSERQKRKAPRGNSNPLGALISALSENSFS